MNQTRKFFIYTRKSTDTEDRQVRSIADQLAELRELAKKEMLEIVDVFVEKQTAKIPGRPIFGEMIARIEKGEASGILAWHPDRLARNNVDGGKKNYNLFILTQKKKKNMYDLFCGGGGGGSADWGGDTANLPVFSIG